MKRIITIDLADVLGDKFPQGFHVPASIDIESFLDFADTDWSYDIEVDSLLEPRRQVAVIWGIDAVKIRRPDLTDQQAWEVLTRAKEDYLKDSCDLDFLESTAEGMFPPGFATPADLVQRLADLREHLRAIPDGYLGTADYDTISAKIDALALAIRKE